jgi:hypothetical protein
MEGINVADNTIPASVIDDADSVGPILVSIDFGEFTVR